MLTFHALSPPRGHCSPQLVQSLIPRLLLPYVYRIGTKTFQRQVVSAVPSHNVQRLKEIADVMHERSVLIFNGKKAALEKGDDALKHQVGEGRDVMSILRKSNFADGTRRARAPWAPAKPERRTNLPRQCGRTCWHPNRTSFRTMSSLPKFRTYARSVDVLQTPDPKR